MSNKCINFSSKEWKDLQNKYGEVVARHITALNNMDVPSLERAEEIINSRKKINVGQTTTTQPSTSVEITKSNYTRQEVQNNPDTAYVFTENTHSITAFPNRSGGGSAVIRPEPNAFAIVTKKKYDYNTRENVDYSDTEADFKEFTEVNTRLINELKNSGKSKIKFPQGFATDKAKMPTRFAEWLQKALLDNFGLVTELNSTKTGLISKSTQPSTNLPGPETKINIYAGTGENAELSNFAKRPFTLQGVEYDNVEQYFQLQKFQTAGVLEFDYDAKNAQEISNKINEIATKIANTKSGAEAKKLGGTRIAGTTLNEEFWNKINSSEMKKAIKASFEQNPAALQKLLATGNAELTHTQESPKSKWRTEFPKLLMEVREELKSQQPSTQPTSQQEQVKKEVKENKPRLSETVKKKIVDGLNYYFMDALYSGGNPDALYNSETSSTIINILFDRAFQNVVGSLKNKFDSAKTVEEKKNIVAVANLLKSPEVLKEIRESHRKLLKSFNIEIEAVTDDTEVNSKDNAFAKEGHKISLDDSINGPVKMLIASLTKTSSNELGLPELVDYEKTKNLIANTLVNTVPEYSQIIAKLKDASLKNPELTQLVSKLGEEIKLSDNINSFRLKTQFLQSFSKNKNTYFLTLLKKDGNIVIFDSNANKLKDQLKLTWYNNLKDSTDNGVFTLKQKSELDRKRDLAVSGFKEESPKRAALLRANVLGEAYKILGIELSDKNLADNYTKLVEILDAIKQYGGISNIKNLYEGKEVAGRISELADLEAKYSNTVELQSINAEGETVYGISLNNYLSLVINEINTYAGNEEMLREKLPHLFNTYTENSVFLKRILEGNKIQLDILDGLKVEGEDGTATKDLEVGDKWVQQITSAAQGFYSYLRAADRGIENGFRIEGGLLVESKLNGLSLMLDYLKDEINTAVSFKKGNGKNIKYYNQKLEGSKYQEGERLRFFKDIITSINEDSLQELMNSKSFDVDKFIKDNEKVLIKDIESWINNEVGKVKAEAVKYGLLNTTAELGELGISKELIDKFDNADNVIEISTMNQIAAYIEQSKIFVGDPLFYKSNVELFKRTSMFNGTKKVSAVGHDIDNWLNENRKRYDGKAADGKINSIILEDNKVKSSNLEMIKQILSNAGDLSLQGEALRSYLEAYESMDEADAQGYITLDEYRELMSRSGDWLPEHEEVYKQEMKFYDEVINKGNLSYLNKYTLQYKFLIQPLKTQHVGPLVEGNDLNLYIPSGYKHSLMPLIPSVVYGRNIENLLKYMTENKVGLAQYTSANKFGSIVGTDNKTNKAYNENGEAIYEDLITQTINYKYIGIQLDIAPKVKKEITASTQDRKLTMTNLYKDGEAVNPELNSIVEEYNLLQSKIILDGLNEIVDELGLEPILDNSGNIIDYNTVDRSKFADYIKRSAESRNNPDNIIKAIERLKDKDVVVDSLLFRDKIVNLLNAIIENNTIREKRLGGASPQASSTLMESKGTIRKGSKKASNHLKFYNVSKVTGHTLAMQVEKSIPKEWKYWVEKLGGLDKFNELVAETNRLYYEYHDNPKNKNNPEPKYPIDIRILMAKGFRIPNQGPNSTDAAIVSRFLPYTAGESLIVPTEMVAKAGSDFDIDKFNIYLPHVRLEFDDNIDITKSVNKQVKSKLKSSAQFTEEMLLEILDKDPLNRTEFEQDVKKIYDKELEKVSNIVYDEYSKTRPTKAQIQNRLLEIQLEIVLHKDNARQLLAPISDYIVKDIMLESVDSLKNESRQETMADIISPYNVMQKFKNFLAGKAGVGQTAVHLTNHVLSQVSGLFINDSNPPIFFKHNKNKDGYASLGGVTDVNNKYIISETLSAFLNAYVDIARDPYIFRLNAGTKVANTIFYMLRLGADPVWVARFMNQPSIKMYVEKQGIDEAEFKKLDKEQTKRERINKVLTELNSKMTYDNMLYTKSQKYKTQLDENILEEDLAELKTDIDGIKESYKNINIDNNLLAAGIKNQTDGNLQAVLLDQFLEYQRQAVLFQEMVRATSPDTKGLGKNINSVKSLLELQDKVKKDNFIGNVDRIFDTTFIGSFNNVVKQTNTIYKQYLISELPQFSEKLRAMDKKYSAITRGIDAKEKISNFIYDDFIFNLIASAVQVSGNNVQNVGIAYKKEKSLFKGVESLPRKIIHIKKGIDKNSHLLKNNLIIQEFLAMLDSEKQDNLKIFSRKINTHTQNVLTDAFREIFEIDEELGNNLVKFGLIQSGLNNSPITFVKLIPEERYFDIVQKVITFVKQNPESINFENFERAFELQNIRFAPKLKSRMNNYTGFYEDEPISETNNKGKFYYIKKIFRNENKESKEVTYKTHVYKRSDYPNDSQIYTYKNLGESIVDYLTPKLYSNTLDENDFIKQKDC
jgi:predicted NAD-dependent protein-ADP-ribosyltransferase YbiA (DUF1768 family)